MTKDENLEELKRRRIVDNTPWGSPRNVALMIGTILFFLGFGTQLVIVFMMTNGSLTSVPSWIDLASHSSMIISLIIIAFSFFYWWKDDPFNKDLRREIVMNSDHDDQFCLKYRVGDKHKKLPVKFEKHLSNGKTRVVLDATPDMLTTEKIEEIRSNT